MIGHLRSALSLFRQAQTTPESPAGQHEMLAAVERGDLVAQMAKTQGWRLLEDALRERHAMMLVRLRNAPMAEVPELQYRLRELDAVLDLPTALRAQGAEAKNIMEGMENDGG